MSVVPKIRLSVNGSLDMAIFLDMAHSIKFLWSMLSDEQRQAVDAELNVRPVTVHKMLRTLKAREEVKPA